LREHLLALESLLIKEFRPTFLAVQYEQHEKQPFVHVVISAREFSKLTIDARVALVYKKIFEGKGELLPMLPVIVEPFSSTEMVEIFEYIR
jgi:uncharacterized OB-fold protein